MQRPLRASQVKSSRVRRSAVSSPPTLWQCQTSRPLPIRLVLLLIREPASQPASQEFDGSELKEGSWTGWRSSGKAQGCRDVEGGGEQRRNSCCASVLTNDVWLRKEVKKKGHICPLTHLLDGWNDAVKRRLSVLLRPWKRHFWVKGLHAWVVQAQPRHLPQWPG